MQYCIFVGDQKRLNLIKCLFSISNEAILASRLGLGLQINLQICGFYEGLLLGPRLPKIVAYLSLLRWLQALRKDK